MNAVHRHGDYNSDRARPVRSRLAPPVLKPEATSMVQVPVIPRSAPFTAEQRAWLNGYLAGLFSYEMAAAPAVGPSAESGPADTPKPAARLLVLFGSQTGTAEQLARRFSKVAQQRHYQTRVLSMAEFASIDWQQEQRLVIITSTWGDGDPPDNAIAFWNFLNSEQASVLSHVAFSVLALGDRNYTDFCGAGKKFDARLERLGAKRIFPRADCDTDYEPTAAAWIEGLWPALENASSAAPSQGSNATGPSAKTPELVNATVTSSRAIAEKVPIAEPGVPGATYSRQRPFPARLLTNRRLNGPGSAKDTRHFEVALHGSNLSYEPGDALGVFPSNCPELVDQILQALDYCGDEPVRAADATDKPIRGALLHDFQITQIPKGLLELAAERTRSARLRALIDPASAAQLDEFLQGRQIIDVLEEFKPSLSPAEFAGTLRKLQPRLYSISSSPKAHPGEVHLTVAVVRYETFGRKRKGVCSTFLAERVGPDTPVPVFVQTSHGFRLPADGKTPIIMIGPGTGIAPFRAFLEERAATGASGRNWLFFGDQHSATDFLYRDELESMQAKGVLTRLDTAFSRDQAEKCYVQHRMITHAPELWAWLENGAHFYVCGDAKRMAKDVDAALHQVVQSGSGKTPEQAAEYVQRLKAEKRYQRDVY